MLGSVLATLKMSACSRAPSAGEQRAADEAADRETSVPAAITAQEASDPVGRSRRSRLLRSPGRRHRPSARWPSRALVAAPRRRDPRRRPRLARRDAASAARRARTDQEAVADHPESTSARRPSRQTRALTRAARMGSESEEPSGAPSRPVTARVTWCTPSPAGGGLVAEHAAARGAERRTAAGPLIVSSAVGRAPATRTATGWSRPLTSVDAERAGVAGEGDRAAGASISICAEVGADRVSTRVGRPRAPRPGRSRCCSDER